MTVKLVQATPKRYPLDWTAVFFFTTIHLLALSALWCFSWSALGITLFLHWLFGSIGICLGYHRLLSHRSLQVPRWLEYAIAILGTLALQGGPIFWVAGHRGCGAGSLLGEAGILVEPHAVDLLPEAGIF